LHSPEKTRSVSEHRLNFIISQTWKVLWVDECVTSAMQSHLTVHLCAHRRSGTATFFYLKNVLFGILIQILAPRKRDAPEHESQTAANSVHLTILTRTAHSSILVVCCLLCNTEISLTMIILTHCCRLQL